MIKNNPMGGEVHFFCPKCGAPCSAAVRITHVAAPWYSDYSKEGSVAVTLHPSASADHICQFIDG